jgi:nitric oxide reductase subunit B
MLGIGLMLFCLRGLAPRAAWDDRLLKGAFWALNIGLAMMVLISILPVGAMQAWASVTHGLWYARTAEFMHQPLVHLFIWLRVPGDVVFSIGPVLLLWFAAKLVRGVRVARARPARTPLPAE